MSDVYKYLKYAMTGDKKSESQHDMSIFMKSEELAKKYEIEYDPNTFVPTDYSKSVFSSSS